MQIIKKVVIGIFIVLVLLLIGLWAFISFVDVNKYIPQVTELAGQATGRQIKIGSAGLALSLSQGLVLELKDVSMSDDVKFSNKPFMTVNSVRLALDVRSALMNKGVVVSDITVGSPDVTIISAQDGSINAATIGVTSPASQSVVKPSSQQSPGNLSAAALPVLLVKKINIVGGRVHYISHLMEPAMAVDVKDVTVGVSNFSLTDQFDFVMTAAVLSTDKNVNVTGKAAIDVAKLLVYIKDVQMSVAVDKIAPDILNDSLPVIKQLGFKKAAGSINVVLKSCIAGVKGLESLDAQVEGQIKEVTLDGVNILASALNSIPMLPGLMDMVLPQLPVETQADIKKGLTIIDSLEFLAQVDKDKMTVSKANISTRDLVIFCTGIYSLAGTVDLNATLLISVDLTKVLVNKVSDLEGLKNETGRINIPFKVSGPLAQPKTMPDMDYISKNLLLTRGSKEVQKVFSDLAVGKAVGDLFNSFLKKN